MAENKSGKKGEITQKTKQKTKKNSLINESMFI